MNLRNFIFSVVHWCILYIIRKLKELALRAHGHHKTKFMFKIEGELKKKLKSSLESQTFTNENIPNSLCNTCRYKVYTGEKIIIPDLSEFLGKVMRTRTSRNSEKACACHLCQLARHKKCNKKFAGIIRIESMLFYIFSILTRYSIFLLL